MSNKTEVPIATVNVFWSMRSPYCYVSLDRCIEIQKKYNMELILRPVWPLAFWNPDWFDAAHRMEYRGPYQDLDAPRSAAFRSVPFAWPNPDPIRQEEDWGKILPLEEQDLIRTITHAAAAAAEMGKGWDYLNQVSRMLWNGTTIGWDQGTHLRDAIERAGIDADATLKDMADNPDKYDEIIKRNHEMHLTNVCGHYGVPLFDFQGEPFFGQDRLDQLVWRMKQFGLTERSAD
ncbi:MAG: DsbA family protein [Hyphomicrobiaceae bacterium]